MEILKEIDLEQYRYNKKNVFSVYYSTRLTFFSEFNIFFLDIP